MGYPGKHCVQSYNQEYTKHRYNKSPTFSFNILGAQMNESLTCPCCLCQNLCKLLQDVFWNCAWKEYEIHFNNIGFQTKGLSLVEKNYLLWLLLCN
jgi:hypothetical protein